ncbi:E3 SUMO-protein ligase RanBP2-like [Nasonia vitripennis]|uniref:RanBD1 domain-containing protein n=1 Tax=Nasonia vitripennis TaxID=7425 RepID=A0A7M7GG23_NASVI|nr:E3 SUMO-protein ligase RanBP2-like [Nasonia vitripennis]
MLWTKEEVDRHVQDVYCNMKDETEKILMCYKVAELYYSVADFESARQYLSRYVEFHKEAKAHKLMGEILEALGQKKAAIAQYECAFKLNSREKELIPKVCELLSDPEIASDNSISRFWVENAYRWFPRKLVSQLKEKIPAIERLTSYNEENLEKLIKAELVSRPTDVQLNIKLLKHYVKENKLDEAYKYAIDIETTHVHRNSLVWYQELTEILLKCKNKCQKIGSFWIAYISSLERYAALSIKGLFSSIRNMSGAVKAVYNFDQCLFEAKLLLPFFPECILKHMWGQLNFHLACLLLMDTHRDPFGRSEAAYLCAPLLLTAMLVNPIDSEAFWDRQRLQTWYHEGSYRCSQAGHVLYNYARGNHEKLINNIKKFCTGPWKKLVYKRIFVSKFYYEKVQSSYFLNNNAIDTSSLRFLSHNELQKYDQVAEEVWSNSLHHQVWPAIKLHTNNSCSSIFEGPQPNLTSHLFPDIPFSVENLSQTSPDTLSRLDVDAFLNSTAFCATAVIEKQQTNTLGYYGRSQTLPADLTVPLCSTEQEKWWHAACKIHRKELLDDNSKLFFQQGLEAVRCIGNNNLHPYILVHLARIFHYRAKQLKNGNSESNDIPALESRSEMYWSAAVPLLQKLQNNQTISSSYVKLFDYAGSHMDSIELTHAIEEGKIGLARKLVRSGQDYEAIKSLEALKCPEASFEQGKIYLKLNDKPLGSLKEIKISHITLLRKALECFYLTMDRLCSPDTDPKHPLKSELDSHIAAVQNQLKKFDTDTSFYAVRNSDYCDDLSSNKSYSSAHEDEHLIETDSLPELIDAPLDCDKTPLSLERLDAKIDQIARSIESLKDQNRAILYKLDEFLKISAYCKENMELNAKSYPQPAGIYGYCASYSDPSLVTPGANRASAQVPNLIAVERDAFSSAFVYPPTADTETFPSYSANNNGPAYASAMINPLAVTRQNSPDSYNYPAPRVHHAPAAAKFDYDQRLGGQWPMYGAHENIATQQQPAKSEPELCYGISSTTTSAGSCPNVIMTISETLPTTYSSIRPTFSFPTFHTTAPVKTSKTANTFDRCCEDKVFCRRAILYRFNCNTREWIERGTGEMKLLYHREHGTYRLLLQRERLHKHEIVCDFPLTSDLEFRELGTSDTSLTWTGMNHAEADSPEVETLAVKFETPGLVLLFKRAVEQAQKDIVENQV